MEVALLKATAARQKDDSQFNLAKKSYEELAELYLDDSNVDYYGYVESQMGIASCCFQSCQFEEGYSCLNTLMEFLREYGAGEDHALMLETRHNMANGLVQEGKYSKALEQYEQIASVEETKGVVDRETLVTKAAIAMCLSSMSKQEEALKLYYETLESQKQLLGANHLHIATTKSNIATLLSDMGRHQEAMDVYQQVLQFKIDHNMQVAGVKQNILKQLYFLKRYDEALVLAKELEGMLPASQPYPLLAEHRLYMARIYTALEDYETALQTALEGRKIHEAIYKPTDRYMLKMLSTLADCHAHLDHYDDALTILRDVEEKAKSVDDLKGLVYCRNDLANVLTVMGRSRDALPLMEYAECELVKLVGDSHPDVQLFKESKRLILRKISNT